MTEFEWLIKWTSRMCKIYGGTCYEKNGKIWDWGQAACREIVGPDWSNKNNLKFYLIEERGYLLDTQKQKLIDWENGIYPEWFNDDHHDYNRTLRL